MKVKIDCDSPLLEYTLKSFLKEYLSEDGIVITDNPEKEGLLIGREIPKPFSKSSLMLHLEKHSTNTTSFDEALDNLIDKFKTDLKNLIKEYYGKK